jgi:hypothetical protein
MKDIKYTIHIYALSNPDLDEADTTFDITFINGNDKMHINEIVAYKVTAEMTKHPGFTLCDWEVVDVCLAPGQDTKMNRTMKKVYALAERTDFQLRSTMSLFNRSVKIVHLDETFVFYENAFLMKRVQDKHLFIIAFTEHQGFHVFHACDLQSYRQYDACIPAEECKCPDECVFHPVEKECLLSNVD